MVVTTDYGTVRYTDRAVTITANGSELRAWASRPGRAWPLSKLAEASLILALFDETGLIDLSGDESIDHGWIDVPADEFNAWSSDVLREALPEDHVVHYVTVGQFKTD